MLPCFEYLNVCVFHGRQRKREREKTEDLGDNNDESSWQRQRTEAPPLPLFAPATLHFLGLELDYCFRMLFVVLRCPFCRQSIEGRRGGGKEGNDRVGQLSTHQRHSSSVIHLKPVPEVRHKLCIPSTAVASPLNIASNWSCVYGMSSDGKQSFAYNRIIPLNTMACVHCTKGQLRLITRFCVLFFVLRAKLHFFLSIV